MATTTQQPRSSSENPNQTNRWKYDLCGCCDSCSDCCLAFFCDRCYDYMAAKAAGEDTCCAILVFFFPVGMCCVRQNAREKRGIEGSCCGDFCYTYFCHMCSSIQIKREFSD